MSGAIYQANTSYLAGIVKLPALVGCHRWQKLLAAPTAHGSTNSYIAFVPDESFCFGGILTTPSNLMSKLALESCHPSIP